MTETKRAAEGRIGGRCRLENKTEVRSCVVVRGIDGYSGVRDLLVGLKQEQEHYLFLLGRESSIIWP